VRNIPGLRRPRQHRAESLQPRKIRTVCRPRRAFDSFNSWNIFWCADYLMKSVWNVICFHVTVLYHVAKFGFYSGFSNFVKGSWIRNLIETLFEYEFKHNAQKKKITFLARCTQQCKRLFLCLKFPWLRRLVLLISVTLKWRWVWSICRMILTGEMNVCL